MPANSFGDAHLRGSWPDVMSQKGLSPEGKLPLADWTGENPVGWLTESSSATPSTKSPNQTWIEWNRLLGCFCFARADCLFDNRSQDANLLSSEVDVSPLRLAELIEHFRQRELAADNEWKTLSTTVTYEGYLRKWIVPRWGATNLSAIRAVEVELWLRTLPLARASRAKIRNLMSVLFNHARRHDFTDHNPITLVRQSAKRRTVPEVLLPSEINLLVPSLRDRERTLVLLAAGTGLRMSELFGLKWNGGSLPGVMSGYRRGLEFEGGQLESDYRYRRNRNHSGSDTSTPIVKTSKNSPVH